MFKMKKIAAIAAAAVMAASAMAVNVGAESTDLPTSDSINNDMININISPYAGTSVSYDCTKDNSPVYVGRFTASKSNITFTIYPSTVGSAIIKLHTGSENGPVAHSFFTPSPGTDIPTITDNFTATVGTTYYITAETNAGYIQASGSFYISY